MDLKSAFVPAGPFFRTLLGDPRQSPGGVADNLREHSPLKASIGLRAENRWAMPQELPKVACSLLRESGETSLLELMQAAEEVSGKALGSGWNFREYCPCTLPAGAHLQQLTQKLRNIQPDTPEGLIAGQQLLRFDSGGVNPRQQTCVWGLFVPSHMAPMGARKLRWSYAYDYH